MKSMLAQDRLTLHAQRLACLDFAPVLIAEASSASVINLNEVPIQFGFHHAYFLSC